MTGAKVSLLAAAGLATVDTLPFNDWEKLGIVGVLIVAIIALWKDSKKRDGEYSLLLQSAIKTMAQVRDAIQKCPGYAHDDKDN